MVTTQPIVKSNRTRGTGLSLTMLSCPVTSARTLESVSVAAAAAAAAAATATAVASNNTVGYYVPSMPYYDIPALTPAPAASANK